MFEPSVLFWYKPVFMAELLIAEWMYSFCLKKRPRWPLRALVSAAVCFGIAFLFPVPWLNAIYSSLMFIVMTAVTVLMMKYCYDEPWINILFCALASYITRHIAYSMYDLVIMLLGMSDGLILGIYGGDTSFRFNVFTAVIYVNCYFLTYWLLLILLGSRLRGRDELVLKNLSFLVLAAFIVAVDIVLNAFVVYYSYDSFDRTYLSFMYIYNIFCSLLAFIIQFGMVSRKALQTKLDVISRMWSKDREQYRIAKENADRINMLCHDLKYRLRNIDAGTDREEIDWMKEVIAAYDTGIKTGNDALDVILNEKSMLCRSENIRFTCMADGCALSFMSAPDIYSLFGNAVDNAIEASRKVADTDKRIIGIVARRSGDMLSVNVYNYFEGELKFRGGLPVTTKSDAFAHGYGVRSISMITEKYGGDMSVVARDGIFNLNMLFRTGAQDRAGNA